MSRLLSSACLRQSWSDRTATSSPGAASALGASGATGGEGGVGSARGAGPGAAGGPARPARAAATGAGGSKSPSANRNADTARPTSRLIGSPRLDRPPLRDRGERAPSTRARCAGGLLLYELMRSVVSALPLRRTIRRRSAGTGDEVAGREAARSDLHERRLDPAADFDRDRTPGVEAAAGRRCRGRRELAADHRPLPRPHRVRDRDRLQERLSIRMERGFENVRRPGHLGELAEVHHRDPIAEELDGGEIVGDEQAREPHVAPGDR